MDGSKDEALKCLKFGKNALENGDRSPLPVDSLLAQINSAESVPRPEAPQSKGCPDDLRSRRNAGSSLSPSAAASKNRVPSDVSSREYTEEQITVVRQVKKQRDYYEMLRLERNCTVDDVKKAYRKLSLKVHPDKNKAPGAEEAFKAVSKAFQCLHNEESRRRYDISGSDEPTHHRPPAARDGMNGFSGFYEAEIDPEEIFRNFFFGGMPQPTTPSQTFRFRTGATGGRRTHHDIQGSDGFNLRAVLQILPVILLVLLNFFPSSHPPYMLSKSRPYEQRLETERGVPYFVRSGKFEEYPYESVEKAALEEKIEREYVRIVLHHCRYELQRQRLGLANKTPHCEMFRRYEATASATAAATTA
ncbi:unnamed protein product [Spirodela intermedia]|uniref:J domain-containing protein n=1 Tax=Spirodela intermedia TaxID=51605 RepID=A0A7I8IS41_SPIIN|nr:unnamed protein product [Spirodela intermedia]CAA6660797.1 unnamed protein product [Spirodela intermedia]